MLPLGTRRDVMEKNSEEMGALVRQVFGSSAPKPFKPFAMYQDCLDWFLVQVRDCSVTEHRINELIAVLEDNYPAENEKRVVVGFVISYARKLCKKHHLRATGTVKLEAVLDALALEFPHLSGWINSVPRQLLQEFGLEEITFPIA